MKKIITWILGLSLLVGGFAGVGQVVSAPRAEALTKYNCTSPYLYYGFWHRTCYYDYNWYEESWWGGSKKDGWYREPYTVIYKTW